MALTAAVEARCDLRTVANIYKLFPKNLKPKTKSELIRLSLELLEQVLISNSKVPVEDILVKSTAEAADVLRDLGPFQRKGRGIKALAAQLELEHKASTASDMGVDFDKLATEITRGTEEDGN